MEHEQTNMILFGPTNEKDLKRLYPELKEADEFRNLTTGEMLFVWHFANATSDLVKNDNLPEKSRAIAAYDKAFKSHPNEERKRQYYSLNFPDKIRLAIDRMKRYEPTIRIRSRVIAETILENFEKMVKVDLEDFNTTDEVGNTEINWTGRNNYVTSAKTILQTLPDLINQVEHGYGVKDKKGSADSNGEKAIDRFHATKHD